MKFAEHFTMIIKEVRAVADFTGKHIPDVDFVVLGVTLFNETLLSLLR